MSGNNLRNVIERLQEIQSVSPNDGLKKLIAEKLDQLTKLTAVAPITFDKLAQQLTIQGGLPPYRWSAVGLPPALSIDAVTGQISGTPQQAGTFHISV